jgi:hypothetical protein
MISSWSLLRAAVSAPPSPRGLVAHLITLYAHGAVELDDELLAAFHADAPLDLRERMITNIGIDIDERDDAPASRTPNGQHKRFWETHRNLIASIGVVAAIVLPVILVLLER